MGNAKPRWRVRGRDLSEDLDRPGRPRSHREIPATENHVLPERVYGHCGRDYLEDRKSEPRNRRLSGGVQPDLHRRPHQLIAETGRCSTKKNHRRAGKKVIT